ncbi:hypothetical protein [Chryseobacterium scophthalmum]|uniref:RiboL-PSP-HEPN domain-containing protein n=1 Tax=Chryseobacterium scophthalmum TaxID=59733 RepID=A0A1N6IJQ6_9FLAO|nr:hypothetical protein [Chryseobacterium scophthalmum]SIO32264.1 hypothetical protein SAMN05421769_3466 [Chryseobacterium scophthalmum]
MNEQEVLNYSDEEVIKRIIKLTEGLANFWKSSHGWAPIKASDLMSKSRLDWQASLARTLNLFRCDKAQEEDGALILAWATLGSLVEGTLKLFLSVWYNDYEHTTTKTSLKGFEDTKGDLIEPDILMLEKLRLFFDKEIYPADIQKIWDEEGRLNIIEWIQKIQYKRNAIHAYKHRDIGSFKEFFNELRNYLIFMRRLTDTFPYPDDMMYKPTEI